MIINQTNGHNKTKGNNFVNRASIASKFYSGAVSQAQANDLTLTGNLDRHVVWRQNLLKIPINFDKSLCKIDAYFKISVSSH